MENIWPDSVEFPQLQNINDINDWTEATKQIYNEQDVANFQKSIALSNLQHCLFKICSLMSNKNVPIGVLDDSLVSFEAGSSSKINLPPPTEQDASIALKPEISAVISVLEALTKMIQDNPPLPGPRRYGNMACRSWHDQVHDSIDELLKKHFLPFYKYKNFIGFNKECRHYILNSFGSRQRLDYGTGHELSYLAFINSLIMCDILDKKTISGEDLLVIFAKYYDLVKKLILTYTLEPAGSHGVWGLDDHFHLVYILGSSQFVDLTEDNTRMIPSPSSVLKPVTLQKYRTSNLYFNAISFIRKVKTGPFNEHSPILYDVSAVKNWTKVNRGMIKMWFVEVLSKFPVVQHFYFGNVLYPWKDSNNQLLPRSTEANKDKQEEVELNVETKISEELKTSSHGFMPSTLAPWTTNRRPIQATRKATPNIKNDESVVTKAPWAK